MLLNLINKQKDKNLLNRGKYGLKICVIDPSAMLRMTKVTALSYPIKLIPITTV